MKNPDTFEDKILSELSDEELDAVSGGEEISPRKYYHVYLRQDYKKYPTLKKFLRSHGKALVSYIGSEETRKEFAKYLDDGGDIPEEFYEIYKN